MHPFIEIPAKEREELVSLVCVSILFIASCPFIGGDQDWFIVDIKVAIAPVGSPLSVALNQASAKQVVPVKFPLTQATDQKNG